MSQSYTSKAKVLLIGSVSTLNMLKSQHLNFDLDVAPSMDQALDYFSKKEYLLLIWETDEEPSENHKGLEVLEVIQKDSPSTQIIMIVPESDLHFALQGLDIGVYQFLKKPVNIVELVETARLALEKSPITEGSHLLDTNSSIFEGILGTSQAIKKVIHQIKQVAQSDATVLVQGETGTGKDLVATAIHNQSNRNPFPFIAVNTGAIPEGLIDAEFMGYVKGAFTGATSDKEGYFEQAHRGTLFLDELGNMPHKVQISLLRIMEKKVFEGSAELKIKFPMRESLVQPMKTY